MEIGNDFKAFSFYERLDDQYLEYLFESAWDTLSKLYPDYLLDAADYFVIEMYTEEMLYSKHSKKCTFYTLRFGCSFAAVNTIKPQLL